MRTTKDALLVEAALPGVKPEDVDITIENGTLAIRAETDAERSDTDGDSRWLVREISRGTFVRTVSLPNGLEADRAQATFENGVLSLRIPKAEQVKPKQIADLPGHERHRHADERGIGQRRCQQAEPASQA